MAPQRFRRAEAGILCDAADGMVGRFQKVLRPAHAQPHRPCDRRHAGGGAKAAGEDPFACAGPPCNGANKAAVRRLGYRVTEMIAGIAGWRDEDFGLVGEGCGTRAA